MTRARTGTTRARVWLNGRVLPEARARISVLDRGFLYGDAVFETVRIYSGRPFLWRRHYQRMTRSLDLLGMRKPAVDLETAMRELTSACRFDDGAIRITITRGVAEGLVPPERLDPTVLLMSRSIPPGLEEWRKAGVGVIRLPFGHGGKTIVTGHKTTEYATAVQGRIRARRAEAFEAIYVEADGNVSEATTANVFAVFGNTLHTPPLSAGCLPGITRQVVLEIAERTGLRVRQAPLAATRLDRAREIFLTGTVSEVLPVVTLDSVPVGDGTPGPVTQKLGSIYAERIRRHRRAATRAGGTTP
jgi:branched-subunit amino acid aminotransferase/4-amino-4-deoxychorismate lyase